MTDRATSTAAVLIVEGNALSRLFMSDTVESSGCAAIHARNADEAICVLESRSDVALLITNVIMDGSLDGVGLARSVDNRWPAIKIIVVSGHLGISEHDLPAKCLLFAKPYHDDEIAFEIRALIDP